MTIKSNCFALKWSYCARSCCYSFSFHAVIVRGSASSEAAERRECVEGGMRRAFPFAVNNSSILYSIISRPASRAVHTWVDANNMSQTTNARAIAFIVLVLRIYTGAHMLAVLLYKENARENRKKWLLFRSSFFASLDSSYIPVRRGNGEKT